MSGDGKDSLVGYYIISPALYRATMVLIGCAIATTAINVLRWFL